MKRILKALKRFWFISVILLVVLIVVGLVGYYIFLGANRFSDEPEKVFLVWRGQSFPSIVDSLEQQGIVRDRQLFVFVAKIVGGTEHLQVGRYRFQSGLSNYEIFLSIRDGKGNEPVAVSVPEGLQAKQQARILARKIGIDSARYVSLVHDSSFISSLGIDAPSLDGYLLPDTYSFHWQTDEKTVIRELVEQFHSFYNDSLKQREAELGWTMNQVLSLAAIVEGEAILDEERPRIAGVYHNRLVKRMRLEADPTIQYIIEDGPRRLFYDDLKIHSPYNTYRNYGLPPGPVNSPGKAAILASLYPEQNGFLFFVANGQGGHWFSKSYSEHLRNVRKFRRDRRRRQSEALTQIPSGGSQQQ